MGVSLAVTVGDAVLGSTIIAIAVVGGATLIVHDWRKMKATSDFEEPPPASQPSAMMRPHAPSQSGRAVARRTILAEALVAAFFTAVGVGVLLSGGHGGGGDSGGGGNGGGGGN
jgi:hypothetical protein